MSTDYRLNVNKYCMYQIHMEMVRTNVSSESSKYVTSQPRSAMRANTGVLFVDFITQENSQALLTVHFIKTFCLTEWGAVNGRLLSTEWRRHDSIVKLQNELKATHTLPISLLLWSPRFPLIFDHFKAVISSDSLSINSTDSTLTKWMCEERNHPAITLYSWQTMELLTLQLCLWY